MTHQINLAQRGLTPKKSLGQNFMVEENVLAQMVDAADIGPQDAVLEVGAGLGALTGYLAARARRVIALEIDGRFIDVLEQTFGKQAHVEIVQADILQTDVDTLMAEDRGCYKLVANLPYYITSAIIRLLLEGSSPPQSMVFTVQYEVAERLCAAPGKMSLLAVGVQFYGQPQIMARLKPGVFYPRPSVDSALVRIVPHLDGPPLSQENQKHFFRIVRAGFSQPRKQLKNSLSAGLHLSPDAVVHWIGQAGLDPGRRAEALSIEEWMALYNADQGSLMGIP
ncbi:MAG: ribosomal RNA small subunit methyltransferase A [Anaerolineae bacterium]|nr:ribosomal RNA small subunit methyltransferase A [Anaerolineae bacterium]